MDNDDRNDRDKVLDQTSGNIPASTLNPELTLISELHTWDANPNRGDIEAIKRSLQRFGQRDLILYRTELVDGKKTKTVYSGNHRLLAAKELGWTEIAAACQDDLDPNQIKALGIALNRTRDLAFTDDQAMADLLASMDSDLKLDIGFDEDDLTELLDRATEGKGVTAKDWLDGLDNAPQGGDSEVMQMTFTILVDDQPKIEEAIRKAIPAVTDEQSNRNVNNRGNALTVIAENYVS